MSGRVFMAIVPGLFIVQHRAICAHREKEQEVKGATRERPIRDIMTSPSMEGSGKICLPAPEGL